MKRAMDFESAMRILDTDGFSWDSFRELFPFGDISLREGNYQKLVTKVLGLLEDKQQQELLLDLLDTQLCVYLEQTWIQNEQYEREGEQGPFIDGHWITGEMQINSNLRWQYDLRKRDSRAAMLKLPRGEMLLDRLLGPE